MKHIAIYVRVSTSEQTVENQKFRLIEYAEIMGSVTIHSKKLNPPEKPDPSNKHF